LSFVVCVDSDVDGGFARQVHFLLLNEERTGVVNDRVAMLVIFGLSGVLSGSWTPRVPALAEQVHAGPGLIGLVLLAMTVGMLLVAPPAGKYAERFGARTVMVVSTLLSCSLLPFLGVAGSVLWLGLVLLGLGASVGAMEVAMNVGGVVVERKVDKPVMPLLHAGYSIGGLAGSSAAGLAAAYHWSPAKHFTVVAIVVTTVLFAVLRGLPRPAPSEATREEQTESVARAALLRRPVLWLLGSIVLLSAIAEGSSSDWSALLLVTEHGVSQGAAALGYAGFSAAMACTRLAGSWVQLRIGPIRTLVAGALLAGCGLIVAAVAPLAGFAFVGFVLAGAGLAGAFPITLSLAGTAGQRADGSGGEREVAFVSTIAYSGFLVGPPMVGGIAHLTSLTVSFVTVGVLAAVIALAALSADRQLAAPTLVGSGPLPGFTQSQVEGSGSQDAAGDHTRSLTGPPQPRTGDS
jgi:MFS family permease